MNKRMREGAKKWTDLSRMPSGSLWVFMALLGQKNQGVRGRGQVQGRERDDQGAPAWRERGAAAYGEPTPESLATL